MTNLLRLLVVLVSVWGLPAWATSTTNTTAAQVKLDLLKQLETDGFLSAKLAQEAKDKYVDPTQLTSPVTSETTSDSLWARYVSWVNFFKVAGVILLLIAFGGTLRNLVRGVWHLLVQVPPAVYQGTLLTVTITGTLRPELLWASQSFYVAMFCAFANLGLLCWVLATYEKLAKALAALFNLGIPVGSVLSFWGMLYFGALALGYNSQIFGFFAAVCLSGILSFGVYYMPGVLTLYFKEKALNAVVFGHLGILAGYAGLKITGTLPTQADVFVTGLEYYCTIGFAVGLLVGASPFFNRRESGLYGLVFVLSLLAAITGYFFYDLKVIGSILCSFFILLVLEWLTYWGFRGGVVIGSGILGGTLYSMSLLLERFGHLLVLRIA